MQKTISFSTLVSSVALLVLGLMGLLLAASSARSESAFAAGPMRSANAPQVPPNDPGITYSFDPIVTSGLTRPIFITHAKDDRLFIMEQGGRIKIWQSGALLPTPFLSVTNLVQTNNNGYSEEGLLGLAFEPNYASTGRFYIYYTNPSGNQNIARYIVSAGNPYVADALSATILMTIAHPTYGNHNGGWMGFGPDGFLYAAVGDGGLAGDPFCAAQNTSDRRGKVLRLNVAGQLTYTTPASNTFTTTQLAEVWAIGLRNPWRNSFDRQTGDLYMGDVGQNAWEEITFVPAGASAGLNFGWSQREGRNAYGNSCPSSNIAATEPFTDYARNANGGYSVTGGYVYRGAAYPWLAGAYFFGDYATGNVWAAWQPGAAGVFSTAKIGATGFNLASFGEDSAGEIYLADYAGRVLRLSSTQSTPATTTPTPTATTPPNTSTNTPTSTPTSTRTNTPTPTPTLPPGTSTSTSTVMPTSTRTTTPMPTPTTPAGTGTSTATATASPTHTPTATVLPTDLPDLKIAGMRISIQFDANGCYTSTTLGTYVTVQNLGLVNAGPFSVTLNNTRTLGVRSGLQGGQSIPLWFDRYFFETSVRADSGNEVVESDETNNTTTQLLPVPTLPPPCTTVTPTHTPTRTPTLSPTPTIKPGPISPRVSLPLVFAD